MNEIANERIQRVLSAHEWMTEKEASYLITQECQNVLADRAESFDNYSNFTVWLLDNAIGFNLVMADANELKNKVARLQEFI